VTAATDVVVVGAGLAGLTAARRLVDAGFESGHAYGKALRTVKTCVGSEWCRFGTQDSTGLGVKIEQATWGSWMPHKFKIAVSGCPRNCAESGIKDVGVIGVDSSPGMLEVCAEHARLSGVELDLRALIEGLEAVARDAAVVDEQILARPVRGDEPVPLRVVEPLHGSGRHMRSLLRV